MPDDHVARRDVGRLLAGQVVQGLGVLSSVSASLSRAATESFASLRASPRNAADERSILGRGADGSFWVRARVADPAAAPVIEVPDGTALVRILRDGDIHAGPILAPLTAAALAGTARAVASMDVDARTNALTAIADLIRRARPGSAAVRVALARSGEILASARFGPHAGTALDRLADELATELQTGSARLAARLDSLTVAGVLLAGAWSRQSLGDPWLVTELLRNAERTVFVAEGGATAEGDLVAGWVDPELRGRIQVIPELSIATTMRAGQCEAVLLAADDVRPDGTLIAAAGSLAIVLIARHYDVPVFGVDLVSAFLTGSVGRPADTQSDLAKLDTVDLVAPSLVAEMIAAG